MRTPERRRPASSFRYSPLIAAFACVFSQVSLAAPTPLLVNVDGDGGGLGTLRAAITTANACTNPEGYSIVVAPAPSGPFTVSVSTALPAITCPNVQITGNDNITIQPLSAVYGGMCGLDATPSSGLTKISGVKVQNFSYGGAGMCGKLDATGNIVTGNDYGFSLTGSGNIVGNTISQNLVKGVYDSVGGSTISQNTIQANTGFGIYGTDGMVVTANTISQNWNEGVYVGNNAVVTNNTISDNYIGIYVNNSATISGNSVSNNSWNGIEAGAGSTISGNTVFSHVEGSGIDLYDGGTIGGTTGNTLYDNSTDIYASTGTAYGGPLTISNNLVGTPDGTTSGGSAWGIRINSVSTSYSISGNVISGHQADGLRIEYSSGSGTVSGNMIGVNTAGTAAVPNGVGIALSSYGGPLTISNNVISGNNIGVDMYFVQGVILSANKIGTNAAGTAGIANSSQGVYAYCSNTLSLTGNQVSSNGTYGGVFLEGVSGSTINNNLIGTTADGLSALANNGTGVYINSVCNPPAFSSPDLEPKAAKVLNNLFDGNVIAHNNGDGILVYNGSGNVIRGGSIHSNVGKNINLNYYGGPLPQGTDNPAGTDNPNNLQDHPDITSAVEDSGNTVVGFSLSSVPSTAFDVDIYANTGPTTPAGRTFLGRVPVSTNAGGIASGTGSFPGSHTHITATATGPYGTSEFSGTLASLVPAADILPLAINFGNIVVPGTSPSQQVTFTSTGSAPYIIDSIVQAGAPPSCPGSGVSICSSGEFACSTSCVPGTPYGLSAGCGITGIAFNPQTLGAKSTTLYVCDNTSATARAISLSGTGIPITLSVAPTSYNFGNVPLGTQATTVVTITNPSTVAAALSAPTAGGSFAVSSTTCGASLAPSASCSVTVGYSPAATTLETGSLNVVVGNSGNPVAVPLQGTGSVPYAITPTLFDFGIQALNVQSAPHTFTLSNSSGNPVPLGSPSATTGFSVVSTTCSGAIPASGSCSVAAAFTPTANGSATGQLTVPVSLTGGPAMVAALQGTGGVASVSLPSSLDLGVALTGAPDMTAAATLQNSSALAVAISSIFASSPFVATHSCPASLAPGASCSIVVKLTPTTAGNFTGLLTVNTDAPGSPHTSALTAAVQSQQGVLNLPTGLDFGTAILASGPLQQSLQITNSGNGSVDFTSISATAPFALSHNCPASLAPAASCQANLSFPPLVYGNTAGQLTVASNAAGGDRVITLLATVSGVSYGISPASQSFGSIAVGSTSTPRAFIISNNGDSAVPLSGVAVTGPFSIATNSCGTSLGARSSCTAEVAFGPVQPGLAEATLTAQIGLSGAPPATSLLSGNGTQASALTLPAPIDFGSLVRDSTTSVTRSVELRNTGNAVLTFTASLTSGPFVLSSDCGLNLAPAQACLLVIAFTPATVGEFTGNLAIVSNAPGGSGSIPITARVQAAPVPILQIQPRSIGFGDRMVGTMSASQRITVTNIGGAPATNAGMGEITPSFIITSDCHPSILPGQTCNVDVVFRPMLRGPQTHRLRLITNATGDPATELIGRGCTWPRPSRPVSCDP